MIEKRRAKSAAFFWGLLILALTSWPRPPAIPVVSTIPNSDKATHSLLYGVEAFLLYRAVRWPGRAGLSLTRIAAIAGAMAVWGVADEVHQLWIPGRTMEAGDVMADLLGATVGALLASFTSRPRPSAVPPAP